MSATARVDPDFRSEPSTTDAHRTARFGNPPRRPLLIGLLGSLMLLVGGFGAGGVLVRDPLMTNSVIGFWRYGHGHDIAAFLMYGGVGLLLWAWIMLGRDVLAHRVGGRAVLTNAAVWIAPLLLAPPLFTRDIFSYLAQGALPLHGFDPYAVGPDAMPGILTDNVHYFWQDTPAPYGPLFIIIAKTVAWLVGNNIIAGVLLMRLALLPGPRAAGLGAARAHPPPRRPRAGGAVGGGRQPDDGHQHDRRRPQRPAGGRAAGRGRPARAARAARGRDRARHAGDGGQGERRARAAVPGARVGRAHDRLALGPHRQGHRGGHRRVRGRLRRVHPAGGGRAWAGCPRSAPRP